MPRDNQHPQRVNRVIDYIGEHLEGDLSLAHLAQVGCFSPFHFHRIFQTITGETLNAHVRRVRLERAVSLLKASPGKRITDVALDTGFAGTAEFSRAFRGHFGRTASSWDRRSALEKSKICKAPEGRSFYSEEELEQWKKKANAQVRVETVRPFRFVYTRIFAPYSAGRLVDAYHALLAWLPTRCIDVRDVAVIGMSLDDPSITPAEHCRYDLGVGFPSAGGAAGVLEKMVRARGRRGPAAVLNASECAEAGYNLRELDLKQAAVMACAGDLGYVDRAWHYLYRNWLPQAAFEPADFPAMEIFVQLPEEIGWETFNLLACLPVARL